MAMKQTYINFDLVRDCPHWNDGECIHPDGPNYCEMDQIAVPPVTCPCENVE